MDQPLDNPNIMDVTTQNFESDVIEASKTTPVLIDFWATWCGPCKSLGPVLEKIANAYAGAFRLAKVDVDAEQQLAAAFQIRSIPTVMLIKDGQPIDGFAGALPEGQIKELLSKHGIEPLDEVTKASQQTPVIDPDLGPNARIDALKKAIESDSDNADLYAQLFDAFMANHATDEAENLLSNLPESVSNDDAISKRHAKLEFAHALADGTNITSLSATIDKDPENWQARDQLAIHQLLEGQEEDALEGFLYLLEHARNWQDGLAKKRLISAFSMLEDKALAASFRRRMASLLF